MSQDYTELIARLLTPEVSHKQISDEGEPYETRARFHRLDPLYKASADAIAALVAALDAQAARIAELQAALRRIADTPGYGSEVHAPGWKHWKEQARAALEHLGVEQRQVKRLTTASQT